MLNEMWGRCSILSPQRSPLYLRHPEMAAEGGPRRMRPGSRSVRPYGLVQWPSRSTLGQRGHACPLAICKCFFFRPTPAFDLALHRNRIGDHFKILRPDELNWTPSKRVASICTGVVLRDPSGQVIAGRNANIKRLIAAPEHINERAHASLLCRI